MPDPFRTRLLARMARETEGLDQTYLAGARAALELLNEDLLQRQPACWCSCSQNAMRDSAEVALDCAKEIQ